MKILLAATSIVAMLTVSPFAIARAGTYVEPYLAINLSKCLILLVIPAGLEPATPD